MGLGGLESAITPITAMGRSRAAALAFAADGPTRAAGVTLFNQAHTQHGALSASRLGRRRIRYRASFMGGYTNNYRRAFKAGQAYLTSNIIKKLDYAGQAGRAAAMLTAVIHTHNVQSFVPVNHNRA